MEEEDDEQKVIDAKKHKGLTKDIKKEAKK
jgi:hypothetical protein